MMRPGTGMSGGASGSKREDAGHTILELAVVMAVAGIALALSWPSVAALRGGSEVERAATELLYTLRLAHSRAVLTGTRVRVAARTGPDGRRGVLLEREGPAGWMTEIPWRPLPRGAALEVAGAPGKVFNPDGTSSTGGFTVRGGGGWYRCTLTPATGRVRFYRGTTETARAG